MAIYEIVSTAMPTIAVVALLAILMTKGHPAKYIAWMVACCDRVASAVYCQRSAPTPWFCDKMQTVYAEGTSLLLTPHLPPPPRPVNPRERPYDLPRSVRLQVGKLVDDAWYGRGEEGAWRTVFGRESFYQAWPAVTPFLTRLVNSVFRARSSITIISHLHTGKRPSQLFIVRTDRSPDLIIAKIYDPYFFDPGEAISTQPVSYTRNLYETEVSVYRFLERQHHLQLPVPKYYGSFESWLSGRPVYVLLMQYIPGISLREPPRDKEEKSRILAAAIRADWELLRAGVRQGDNAGRNYILRDDGTVVMVDFGVAYLLDKDRRVRTKDNMVKRWSHNYDFQSVGWIEFQEEGGDPEAEVRACLEDGGAADVAACQ